MGSGLMAGVIERLGMKRISRGVVALVVLACAGGLSPLPAMAALPRLPQAVPLVTKTIELRAPSTLSGKWTRIQRLVYGTATSRLGTSAGGENLMIGPEYGVQVPDKTWWYADAAKLRLAHYSDTGSYLGQIKLPTTYLDQGIYFQWDRPIALADGTVVLSSTTIGSPGLLTLSPTHKLSRVSLAEFVSVAVTSGASLYGFTESGDRVRVNPRTGTITPVTMFKGQGSQLFDVSVGTGHIDVTRPNVNLRLNLVDPDHPSTPVHPSVEVVVGADGKLWIYATGVVEVSPDEAYDVVGIFSVDAAGTVSAVGRSRIWYSDADPGDGQHLGMRYGSSRPTLMFIDTGAVRVYRRS
jgi:hypothetical protein